MDETSRRHASSWTELSRERAQKEFHRRVLARDLINYELFYISVKFHLVSSLLCLAIELSSLIVIRLRWSHLNIHSRSLGVGKLAAAARVSPVSTCLTLSRAVLILMRNTHFLCAFATQRCDALYFEWDFVFPLHQIKKKKEVRE